MAQNLFKTSTIVNGMGGSLKAEFIRGGIGKITITIGTTQKEVLSKSSQRYMDKAAEELLAHFTPTVAMPNTLSHELDTDEEILRKSGL